MSVLYLRSQWLHLALAICTALGVTTARIKPKQSPALGASFFSMWQAATDPGSRVIKARLGEGLRELQHVSHTQGATPRQAILEGDAERALEPTSPQVCTVCKTMKS